MSKHSTVAHLVREAASQGPSFVRANRDPVLLVEDEAQRGEQIYAERTVQLEEMSSGEIQNISTARVVPVKKQRSLGSDRILLGRGRENDVVLALKSVSRLHAFFRSGTAGIWTLEDAGSTYGTYVRNVRITSGVVRALADNTPVRFGSVDAVFRTPDGLYEFLRRLAGMLEGH